MKFYKGDKSGLQDIQLLIILIIEKMEKPKINKIKVRMDQNKMIQIIDFLPKKQKEFKCDFYY